jgi:hypothetical protein
MSQRLITLVASRNRRWIFGIGEEVMSKDPSLRGQQLSTSQGNVYVEEAATMVYEEKKVVYKVCMVDEQLSHR